MCAYGGESRYRSRSSCSSGKRAHLLRQLPNDNSRLSAAHPFYLPHLLSEVVGWGELNSSKRYQQIPPGTRNCKPIYDMLRSIARHICCFLPCRLATVPDISQAPAGFEPAIKSYINWIAACVYGGEQGLCSLHLSGADRVLF